MKITIFPNDQFPTSPQTAKKIAEYLQSKQIQVFAPQSHYEILQVQKFDPKNTQVDFFISLGGDGTIIRLAHQYRDLDIPILGVNLGHLGFMADIPQTDIQPSLDEFLKGKYTIEKRLMLSGKTKQNEERLAMNDIVIHRGSNPSLIELTLYVDDLYLNSFQADGLVIATPNGSTAYSLAAGGPILTPELEAIVITPISPHTITNRPIVLKPKHHLRIEYNSPYEHVDVVTDGLDKHKLTNQDSYTIAISNKTFKLVNLNHRDYFTTLREKLGWSGKLRSSN